tara:strand:+ start:211 stop:387 length:177 start_codon:yes stop_codon:yes gene_type:complete
MNNLLIFLLLMAFPNNVFAHDLGFIHLHGTDFILCMMIILFIYTKTRRDLNNRRTKND